ncbi:hypothetical protein [Kosakonia arachidis]|nr:hypothetical protein [Kosakonia arachidis]
MDDEFQMGTHSDQGAALKVDSSHTPSVRSSLGAKLEHSWNT